jgi:Skp family chaperone for outer membrane proteins
MRHIFITLAFTLALALTGTAHAAPEAAATPSASTRIAVVDVQGLMATSKAGKSIQDQINKQRDSFKEEFSKMEKELGDMQKKLADDKDLTPEDQVAKKKEFETRLMEANKLVQQRRQTLEKGASEASMELRKEVVKVVAGIADKEGYTLVITSQNVIVNERALDITDKVLAALDKQLPDMKLKLDTAPAAEPEAKPKKK